MAGIPYPQVFDPKVLIKKDFLDRKFKARTGQMSGQIWYSLQAQRAVNQAIGRVIRHISDYGAIILLDERFQNGHIKISSWLESCKRTYGRVTDLEKDL